MKVLHRITRRRFSVMERFDLIQTTRRGLLRLGTQSALAAAVFAGMTDGPAHAALLQDDKTLWPGFPRQDLTRVARGIATNVYLNVAVVLEQK